MTEIRDKYCNPSAHAATIGGVAVKSRIWLAPMAGVTTRTFRDWHRSVGAGLTHTEMISAVGLTYNNKKTGELIGAGDEPGPTVIQLFSPDAESLARGAEIALSGKKFCAVEINMACPMPKVAKKGSGSALLGKPDEAASMVRVLKKFGLPVWVKTRITDPSVHSITTEEFCRVLAGEGADLIMLHGRTPAQRYEGSADKEEVCRIARLFPGMIVGSGDYYDPSDAEKYLDSGCVAVLAARGAVRDLFLIPKTLSRIWGDAVREGYGRYENPTFEESLDVMIAIGRMCADCEGARFAPVMIRRVMGGLLKGFPGAAALRQRCSAIRDWGEMEEFLSGLR